MKIRSDGIVERLKLVRRPTMPVLPDEIVLEILLRLPVKALLKFKRVGKAWNTLISSPQFAIDNPSPTLAPAMVCCSCIMVQSVVSACGTLASDLHLNVGFQLSIYIDQIFTSCGLGYDHVHDKYKFVTADGLDYTKIFRFGPNYWTFGPDFPYRPVGMSRKTGKFLSGTGTLNWMASMKEKEWVILSFDVANETFGQVSLPRLSGVGLHTYDPVLQASMDCLCFTIQKYGVFEMWMMKEYGVWESWTMISRVDLCLSGSYPIYIPLSISERDALLLRFAYHNLVLYDCDDRKFRNLRMGGRPISVIQTPKACYGGDFLPTYFVYHDSLVLPP
ncbi:hypothetical protein PIB30_074557 [Stylosanthes scabra]|uniref:F-box domain-containing protein n=1 Tax=Stylosanthes scabra TaxID=79078 RepID=A0ABU6URG6_9FABA|nr:hypothetical protein [Stylosanthes scabra]